MQRRAVVVVAVVAMIPVCHSKSRLCVSSTLVCLLEVSVCRILPTAPTIWWPSSQVGKIQKFFKQRIKAKIERRFSKSLVKEFGVFTFHFYRHLFI